MKPFAQIAQKLDIPTEEESEYIILRRFILGDGYLDYLIIYDTIKADAF